MTGINESDKTGDQETTARILLPHLGAAMIATGQAAHEIESELIEVADRLGIHSFKSPYPQLD